ncbi:MAG: hypothetical protein ABR564_09605 [Candidatus Dormibacteria bacterium]
MVHAITIRLPEAVAIQARSESDAAGESINQFVVEAIADAIRRRQAQRSLGNMARRRAAMQAQGRVAPPSEPLIRQLRDGSGRHD